MVSAGGDIRLDDSVIVARAGGKENEDATGRGGNVILKDARFAVLNDSRISADAQRGAGGNILIQTDVLLANNSPITAESEFGADGVVRIDASLRSMKPFPACRRKSSMRAMSWLPWSPRRFPRPTAPLSMLGEEVSPSIHPGST